MSFFDLVTDIAAIAFEGIDHISLFENIDIINDGIPIYSDKITQFCKADLFFEACFAVDPGESPRDFDDLGKGRKLVLNRTRLDLGLFRFQVFGGDLLAIGCLQAAF